MTASDTPSDAASPADRTVEFLRLLSAHEHALMAFVLTLVPSWNDANDIAQDVRLRMWEQFGEYDAAKDFGAWSRAIAYWHVLKWRKASSRRPGSFGPEFMELIAKHLDAQSLATEDRAEALRICLEKLTPQTRKLVENYYAGKKTARELAEEMGRSFHVVRHTIREARLRLAECVERTLAREQRS